MECTAPRISSYFAEMMESFAAEKTATRRFSNAAWYFWNRLAIQASQDQACVRHSLAALSSLHEWIELTKRTPWQNHTFTLYYTKAMTEINESQSSLPVEIVLISCLLFAHCDFLMGSTAAGLTHLRSGHRIISESKKIRAPIAQEATDFIEPIIRGFLSKAEARALQQGTVEPLSETEIPPAAAAYALPAMPEVFEDLIDANKHLRQAVNKSSPQCSRVSANTSATGPTCSISGKSPPRSTQTTL